MANERGMTGRREFLEQVAAGAAAFAGIGRAEAETMPQPSRHGAPEANAVLAGPGSRAAGDLARRVNLTARRLTLEGVPAYTDDFILADVTLDRARRFWNFSGDLSGRYVEALAVLPPPGRDPAALAPLVMRLLATQKTDGRFGRDDLAFTATETGTEHMALLWGNGRLLVGLMAYHQVAGDPAVLAAARRLAGFLLSVREATRSPDVMKRVEGQGAFGFICFTQLAEGLAMLGRATGDRRYLDAGADIVPLLQPRGVQHSHGYLSTLRGAVMLHEAGAPGGMLGLAERLYADLVGSGDYTVDGAVMEYFGWSDPKSRRLLAPAQGASGHDPRNEGCGLADFLRLSLQLHAATGRADYLERAERCLVNGFDHNQFANGDFGSRVFFDRGIKPSESVDRAWWCCTMHGYRAYLDVLDHAIVERAGTLHVQLFEDVDFEGATAAVSLRRTPFGVECRFLRPFDGTLALRRPSWAQRVDLDLNRRRVEAPGGRDALRITRAFAAGDTVTARFTYRLRLLTIDGREIEPAQLGATPVQAALYCGPWLMAADEQMDPFFFGEPWPGNVVSLPPDISPVASKAGRVHLQVTYEHSGFRGTLPLTLRPIGETPADEQKTLAWSLNYRRG
jgi:hypothetical protein